MVGGARARPRWLYEVCFVTVQHVVKFWYLPCARRGGSQSQTSVSTGHATGCVCVWVVAVGELPPPWQWRLSASTFHSWTMKRWWFVAAVVAAVVFVGCEDMAPEVVAPTPAPEVVAPTPARPSEVNRIRDAMAVPDGVEVVTESTASGAVEFIIRNPGAVLPTGTGGRRYVVASAGDGVAATFETPPRRALVKGDGVQFVEVATFEQVAESSLRAAGAHAEAEAFIAQWGELLGSGGLDMDAVEAWHDRQGELVVMMDQWLAEAWPGREVPCLGELLDVGTCGAPGPGE